MKTTYGSDTPGSATHGEESEAIGPYDALALVRADGSGDTFQAIVDQIRTLPGVIHALAAPLARETVELVRNTAA